ncbi:hypothetical protein IAT38_000879 [Cryptococcus sp. DSM 104549]
MSDNQAKRDSTGSQSSPGGSFWSRCHDRWAFVSFFVSLTLYTILSAYSLYQLSTNYDELIDITVPDGAGGSTTTTVNRRDVHELDLSEAFNRDSAYMFAGASALAIGLSLGLLFFVRQFPTFVIWMGPVFAIVCFFAAAGGLAYLQIWSMAAICAGCGALILLTLFLLKKRYRLARELLDTANKAAKAHWSVFWTVMVGLLVQGINSLWNIFTFIAVFLTFEPWHAGCKDGDFCSGTVTVILLLFALFEHMWISGVIANITLCVMAGGPYAHWWYGTDLDYRSETIWALKRAAGTSFGSIAFGSLLVTFVEILHFMFKLISGEYFGDGKGFCACCCSCIISIFENLLKMYNKYVYIRIGVDKYEIGFIQGGKEIWRLFKKGKGARRQGIAALVSDSIIGFALHVTCVANALICAGFTYLYMTMIDGTMKVDHWWDWVILLYAFILALNIGLVLTSALEAGVSTIFVLLDKDPEYLRDRNPAFYEYLSGEHAYSEVVTDVKPRS